MIDSDLFDNAFSESLFGSIFGSGNIFYSSSIFESEELFDKYDGFIDEQSIPHDPAITRSNTCFSQNLIVRNLIESTSKMTATLEDMTMDVVERLLMPEDKCILVDDVPVDQFLPLDRILYKDLSHGKLGEHELDYFFRDVALHPNLEDVVDVKYISKEQLKELIMKARKVKMKLYEQMNKHGPFTKKAKMKDVLSSRVL